MSKTTLPLNDEPPAEPDWLQMAVNKVSGWYGCPGPCFPPVGRWWDEVSGK
jgi:hypothetical protein